MSLYYQPKEIAIQHFKRVLLAARFIGVTLDENTNPKDLNSIDSKLPVLQLPEGTISKSNAIIRFLANRAEKLNPKSCFEQVIFYYKSVVDQWIDLFTIELQPTILALHLIEEKSSDCDRKVIEDLKKILGVIEDAIGKEFYMLNQLTLADIVLYSDLVSAFQHFFNQEFRKTIPKITNWFISFANREQSKKVYGQITLCNKSKVDLMKGGKKQQKKDKPKQKKQKKEKQKQKKKQKQEVKVQKQKVQAAPIQKQQEIDLFREQVSQVQTAPTKKPQIKKKKQVIAKSIIIFDVKVYDQQFDLDGLAKKIYNQVNMDGLIWNQEHKILPVAFGMNKLQMGCVVEDDKVLTEDIFQKIQAWEDDVQSIDVVSMQKV